MFAFGRRVQFALVLIVILTTRSGYGITIDTVTLESALLQDSRTVVFLEPDLLNSADSLDVLVLMDGACSLEYYRFIEASGYNRPFVIVGIVQKDRRKDLLAVHEAKTFIGFLEQEIMPLCNRYATIHKKILVGHSFGGGFVLNTLLTAPQLFDAYLASSPTPIMNLTDSVLFRQVDQLMCTNTFLYLSYGSEDMRQVIKWMLRLEETLRSTPLKKLYWHVECHPGYHHQNVALPAVVGGLNRFSEP